MREINFKFKQKGSLYSSLRKYQIQLDITFF